MQKYLWRGDHYLVYNDPRPASNWMPSFPPHLTGSSGRGSRGADRFSQAERGYGAGDDARQSLQDQQAGNATHLLECRRHRLDWKDTGYMTGTIHLDQLSSDLNAITFIYEGQREFGLDLLRKNLELSYCKWGYLWDGTNCCSAGGDTGEVNYGWDYWFNWSVWVAPAALLNTDITALVKPGGLVHRVIEAGRVRTA